MALTIQMGSKNKIRINRKKRKRLKNKKITINLKKSLNNASKMRCYVEKRKS